MLAFSEILKNQMSKKKKKHKSIRSQIFEKLMDIVLIIISVYIALTVESLAEKKHEHDRLMIYYTGFLNEIKTDTTNLKDVIRNAEKHKYTCLHIIKLISGNHHYPDSVTYYFSRIFNSSLFNNSSMISYKSMLASGDMHLMEDLEMRKALVQLDDSYSAIKLEEDIYLKYLTTDIYHYTSSAFDLIKMKPLNKDYFTKKEFKNLIVSFYGLNSARLEKYKTSMGHALKVIKLLEMNREK